jgi:hypothetical protein
MRTTVSCLMLATALCTLNACGMITSAQRGLKSLVTPDRTLAVASFDENRLPIATGQHGVMVGYIPDAEGVPVDDPRDAQFTYLINFKVISSHGMGELVEGRGVRRVFFSPTGAHASFADPASFSRGREVETDLVKISGRYDPQDTRLTLRMRVYETMPEPVQFEGHPVATPADEPLLFLGLWRGNVGGWILTTSPTSF